MRPIQVVWSNPLYPTVRISGLSNEEQGYVDCLCQHIFEQHGYEGIEKFINSKAILRLVK